MSEKRATFARLGDRSLHPTGPGRANGRLLLPSARPPQPALRVPQLALHVLQLPHRAPRITPRPIASNDPALHLLREHREPRERIDLRPTVVAEDAMRIMVENEMAMNDAARPRPTATTDDRRRTVALTSPTDDRQIRHRGTSQGRPAQRTAARSGRGQDRPLRERPRPTSVSRRRLCLLLDPQRSLSPCPMTGPERGRLPAAEPVEHRPLSRPRAPRVLRPVPGSPTSALQRPYPRPTGVWGFRGTSRC